MWSGAVQGSSDKYSINSIGAEIFPSKGRILLINQNRSVYVTS